jgi:hypothetical protein
MQGRAQMKQRSSHIFWTDAAGSARHLLFNPIQRGAKRPLKIPSASARRALRVIYDGHKSKQRHMIYFPTDPARPRRHFRDPFQRKAASLTASFSQARRRALRNNMQKTAQSEAALISYIFWIDVAGPARPVRVLIQCEATPIKLHQPMQDVLSANMFRMHTTKQRYDLFLD